MLHVREEDVGLDDLLNGGTSLIEDSLEVLAALSGLLTDGTLDKGTLGGKRDLARAVDGGGGLDGLGL